MFTVGNKFILGLGVDAGKMAVHGNAASLSTWLCCVGLDIGVLVSLKRLPYDRHRNWDGGEGHWEEATHQQVHRLRCRR